MNISFETTREDDIFIDQIIDRAAALFSKHGKKIDRLSLTMDLSATNANGCPLDFEKLSITDDFTFVHDLVGIANHINRSTGKLEHCFLPRCSK